MSDGTTFTSDDLADDYERTHFGDEDQTCGTCAHEWVGTCTYEWAKDRPAPPDQTCHYATSQWTRKPDSK